MQSFSTSRQDRLQWLPETPSNEKNIELEEEGTNCSMLYVYIIGRLAYW